MSNFNNEFWVSNISNMNVSLADLGITISAFKTVNLLDKRHYFFDKEMLTASSTNGSLFKKRKKVVVRKVPPVFEISQLLEVDCNALVPSRRRSAVVVEDIHYDELNISDDIFAEQAADLTDQYYKLK